MYSFDFSPESIRRRRLRLYGGLALVVLGLLLARPVYREMKAWRAHRLVAQGDTLLAADKYNEAIRKAQAALQLAPRDSQSLRLMARILTRVGNDSGVLFWNTLVQNEDSTYRDKVDRVWAALRLKRLDIVEEYLKTALDEVPTSTETIRIAAAFSEARGNRDQAIKYATELLQRDPNDNDNLLLLCRQFVVSRDAEQRLQAKELLWSLAEKPEPWSTDALMLLANSVPLTPAEEQRCYEKIKTHSRRNGDTLFTLANLELRLGRKTKPALVQELIKATPPKDPEKILPLSRWLIQQQEYKRVLEILPREMAFTTMDLCIPYLDALAQLDRWKDIKTILTSEKLPLDPALVELYRMRVSRELHEDRLVPLHWDQAMDLAADKPGVLWEIARYAETLGERAQAMRAYRNLAKNDSTARAAYFSMIRLVEDERDTAKLRDIIREVVARYPDDREPLNDLAYLDLLLQQNVPAAAQKARELVEKYPAVLAFRTTLALAALRTSQYTAARMAYEGVNVDWSLVLPGWRAVYAAVLNANGQTESAKKIAAAIPLNRLKPEERLLVQPLL